MEDIEKKRRLVKIGTAVLAILILSLWVANLRQVWRSAETAPDRENTAWLEFREEIDRSLAEMREQLERQRSRQVPATGSDELILEDILKETAEIASSSVSASSSATTTRNEEMSSCPEWVNCMPGPDRGVCQVPPGCEGITQIAY